MQRETRHSLIGGVPKAATTSLFRYLSDYPEVCPASRKETYFFARAFDFKQVCTAPPSTAGFQTYFAHCSNSEAMRLEATPYTLYARNAASRIMDIVPNPSLVFILRDPVERLFSDYRFHHLRGHPTAHGTFDVFVGKQLQLDSQADLPTLLQLGCYANYLQDFYDNLQADRICVIFFEELRRDPVLVLQNVCQWAGLSTGFHANYDFQCHNQTAVVRNHSLHRATMKAESVSAAMRQGLMQHRNLLKLFESAIRGAKSAYARVNHDHTQEIERPSPDAWQQLYDYYAPTTVDCHGFSSENCRGKQPPVSRTRAHLLGKAAVR